MNTNKNPYHNYNEIPKIVYEADAIEDALNNGTLSVPYGVDYESQCSYQWYMKHFGFCIALTKDDMQNGKIDYCPSLKLNEEGEITTFIHREKAKLSKKGKVIQRKFNKKKGNPTYNSRTNEWEYEWLWGKYDYISNDIQSYFEICRNYRQISCGLSKKQRQIVVCDFDEDFTEGTIDRLERICKENSLPHFTYLERHLDTNHYQIGWILNKAFDWDCAYQIEHSLYKAIVRGFAKLFGSDPNYKGMWIKNPNCINLTETQWFNDTIDKDCFVLAVRECFKQQNPKEDKEVKEVAVAPKKTAVVASSIVSRNIYLMDSLRNWIWDYRRNNRKFPTYGDTATEAHRIASEIGRATNRGKEEDCHIEQTIKSVFDWSVKHYKAYDNSQIREFAIWVEKTQKEERRIDVYNLKMKGMKNKEIASSLGLSEQTICTLLKDGFLFDSETTDFVRNAESLLNYFYWKENKTDVVCGYIETLERIVDKFYQIEREVN